MFHKVRAPYSDTPTGTPAAVPPRPGLRCGGGRGSNKIVSGNPENFLTGLAWEGSTPQAKSRAPVVACRGHSQPLTRAGWSAAPRAPLTLSRAHPATLRPARPRPGATSPWPGVETGTAGTLTPAAPGDSLLGPQVGASRRERQRGSLGQSEAAGRATRLPLWSVRCRGVLQPVTACYGTIEGSGGGALQNATAFLTKLSLGGRL